MIRGIAAAPVSFGVYGSTDQLGVQPGSLLDAAARAGYSGMELSRPGFFGTVEETRAAFAAHDLGVAGAYVAIRFCADDAAVEHDLATMKHTLDELSHGSGEAALAILADEDLPELSRNPARPWDDHRLALDTAGWDRLAAIVGQALELARIAGVSTSFHPHISTYVESPWEVERLLELTDVGLCIDTGHFQLAGADPTEALAQYGDRVNHVHLKDVRMRVLEQAKAEGRTDFDLWWGDVSTPLGDGDVDLKAFLARLVAQDYQGWLVVEQDHLPLGADPIEPVTEAQAENRRWVERSLEELGAGVGED